SPQRSLISLSSAMLLETFAELNVVARGRNSPGKVDWIPGFHGPYGGISASGGDIATDPGISASTITMTSSSEAGSREGQTQFVNRTTIERPSFMMVLASKPAWQ